MTITPAAPGTGRTDRLTGLLSRHDFLDAVDDACARRGDGDVAVIVADLQGMRHLNLSCGTGIGDEALRECAARVQRVCRTKDTAGRVGDDQFTLLLNDVLGEEHALLAAHKLLALSDEPLSAGGQRVVIRLRVGLALCSSTGAARGALFQGAMRALHAAKAGDGNPAVYRPDLDTMESRDAVLSTDFLHAVSDSETRVVFQGKWSLGDERICGAEALVRWNHPQRGDIDPMRVIDVARFTDRLNQLSSWVLDQALKACASWRRQGLTVPVSVNLDSATFANPLLPAEIADALELWQVKPESLVVELTETTLMAQSGQVPANVEQLSRMGVSIAIDDFGTGHSSLAYLSRLEVQELKIDKRFIDAMETSTRDYKLVQTIIALGRSLGLTVTAEGVEREAQRDLLAEAGCDVIQGFLVSRPVPVDRFVESALVNLR